jgi:hypothetical protein
MTTLTDVITDFDPDSPIALYEIDGLFAVAFLYEGEFWMEILSPGDTVAKSPRGILISPAPVSSGRAGLQILPGAPTYIIRYLNEDSHYSALSIEEFEDHARFVDGPASMLRPALRTAQAQLDAQVAETNNYRTSLESIAYHLRWGRHLPHRTIFGAVSSATRVVEGVLDRPLDLSKPKRPKK